MDRLDAMGVLIAVAETGSFTAAGRRLNIPLPTLSRKLAELEAHLGTRLLARSTRRVAPTEAGAAYVAACKRILDEIDAAERMAAGEYDVPKGELVLAAPTVFGRLHVLPVVAEFLASHPAIDVRLMLSDRNVSLLDDRIDLALRIGALADSTMIAMQVGTVRRVVCASPAFLAAHGTPQGPGALAGQPCVTFEGLMPVSAWSFTEGGRDVAVPVRARLSVNSVEAAVDAAVAGVGLTRLLSYQVARAVAEGKLRLVLEPFEPAPLPVSLLRADQGMVPLKTRRFADFAATRLRQRLAAVSA